MVLPASSSLETKVGTALILTSGAVDEATASVVLFVGLAAEETAAALDAGDPVPVDLIAPGMVIKGTADADASGVDGCSGKTYDFNTDGSFDLGDSSGGCLSVLKTEDAGLTVYCLVNSAKMAMQ
jgi:hypothetical protein